MAQTQYERIIYEKKDHIVKITMNWPERRNALDYLMLDEIQQGFEEADLDDDARVIILCGAGSSFSAGHDVSLKGKPARRELMGTKGYVSPTASDFERGAYANWFAEDRMFMKQTLAMRNVSKPTIAQVHGNVFAAATMQMFACDLVICADDVVFQHPEVQMGYGSTEVFVEPWEFGARKTKEYCWLNEPMNVQEAYRLGAINRVVPSDKLEEEVWKIAKKLVPLPPLAVLLSKKSLNKMLEFQGQQNHWDYHFALHILLHRTEEVEQLHHDWTKAQKEGSVKEFAAQLKKKFEV
jgi:enoyl-CoA hydratase